MLALLGAEEHAAWRNATENAIVRVSCVENIDLTLRVVPTTSISPLLSCWYRLKGHKPPQPCTLIDLSPAAVKNDYDYGPNPLVERFLHGFFFLALDAALQADGECAPVLPKIDRSKMGWLGEAVHHLWNAAFQFAEGSCQRWLWEAFFLVSRTLLQSRSIIVLLSHRQRSTVLSARSLDIALDLHALKCAMSGASHVEPEAFELARGSTHWVDAIWIEHELEARRLWIDPRGVKALVKHLEEEELKYVTQFSERAERWIDLAQLSVLYGLDDETNLRSSRRRLHHRVRLAKGRLDI